MPDRRSSDLAVLRRAALATVLVALPALGLTACGQGTASENDPGVSVGPDGVEIDGGEDGDVSVDDDGNVDIDGGEDGDVSVDDDGNVDIDGGEDGGVSVDENGGVDIDTGLSA